MLKRTGSKPGNHCNHCNQSTHGKQAGSVLLWGLVILLTLTVIGVAAVRMGVTDIRIAGNEMNMMVTYQAAESQLNLIRPPVDRMAPDGALSYVKLALDNNDDTLELDDDSGLLLASNDISSRVRIRHDQRLTMCLPQEGYAMRIEMLQDAGGYDCHRFEVDADSAMNGTGARSHHEMGLMHYTPAKGNTL